MKQRFEEWDIEAKAMNEVFLYFEKVDDRARERFIYHLCHRYFPEGEFRPKQFNIDSKNFEAK